MELDDEDQPVVLQALQGAARRYDENATELRQLAQLIREGHPNDLFAPGEPGAKAAIQLALEHEQQARDARRVARHVKGEVDVHLLRHHLPASAWTPWCGRDTDGDVTAMLGDVTCEDCLWQYGQQGAAE